MGEHEAARVTRHNPNSNLSCPPKRSAGGSEGGRLGGVTKGLSPGFSHDRNSTRMSRSLSGAPSPCNSEPKRESFRIWCFLHKTSILSFGNSVVMFLLVVMLAQYRIWPDEL